jgi:hypothetical protein
MKTPLVFVVFNRPDTTKLVFEAIRKVRPTHLFFIADGPRPDREGETERCALVRSILEGVDWPCKVQKNYSDINMGCKRRVSSGLDWVFGEVEEAIILEDDCLPDASFFPFCEELLNRYRHDERVGHISGINFQFGYRRSQESYYFSRYAHVWGWATWRRAWQDYDVDIKDWPLVKTEGKLNDIFGNERMAKYWEIIFNQVHDGLIDSWAYSWTFCNLLNSRLSVTPHINLVSNIGFGGQATHTTQKNCMAEIPTSQMQFPLQHPRTIFRDSISDFNTDLLYFPLMTWDKKLYELLKRFERKYLRRIGKFIQGK